ncbi:IclR family transcriptional regulator [Alicyclobacillus contaminans]|uniref:IclR family transcriptional regulator n=1 Tax=Alicyclobacillus contaminans TaxID=392016 RepID=UPI000429ADC9|nr:IclR family transcriptional regulator [Alicyclobacillus contaminans]GMA50209.1 IclR family transcriptional regulator [Alicyclobacillus contaminans]
MINPDAPQTGVRAVDRALDILLCFSRSETGLSLSEIAREVGLHKSTVHRLLTSMLSKGFVRKQPGTDKYVLGWTILELIHNVYHSDELTTAVLPVMTRLRDATSETVSLYIRSGTERIRIQAVESMEPVRNVATIGKTYPLYVGASGKVLLAYADAETLEQVLADPSIPADFSREDLLTQLENIRKDGYAISVQERDSGAAALAAPIFGRHRFVAALSVSGPVTRFTQSKMSEYIEVVRESAALITKLLSH